MIVAAACLADFLHAQPLPGITDETVQEQESFPEENADMLPSENSDIVPMEDAEMMPAETGEAGEVPFPQEVTAAPEQQHKIHRVWLWQETRDCLWNLSKKYYGDPWLWKKIYLANKYQILDPKKIYPKQVLIIPPLEESEQ
ncbi:MAG: LysM peptidoglycan-binding domain-containing protein [Endomicrobiales bacterium]|nr:LysM peptidoglycan-binding domain-containing protein [Endomicrobiales bacterium]